jgi:hypothetical protein
VRQKAPDARPHRFDASKPRLDMSEVRPQRGVSGYGKHEAIQGFVSSTTYKLKSPDWSTAEVSRYSPLARQLLIKDRRQAIGKMKAGIPLELIEEPGFDHVDAHNP